MTNDAFAALQAENPLPELLPGLALEAIRDQLEQESGPALGHRAPHDQARRGRRLRARRHRALGGRDLIAITLSVLVVAAIVAGALVTLGDSRPSHGAASSASDLRALTAQLGVFTQPQTAAAKAYNLQLKRRSAGQAVGPLAGGALITDLTRAVPVAGGATVYLFVSSDVGATESAYGVGVAERDSGGAGAGTCCVTTRTLDRPGGPEIESGYRPGHHDTIYYELVPNGVATVRWVFPRHPLYAGGGIVPQFKHALTVTAAVRANVAALRLPQRGAPNHETWLTARGRVLKSVALHGATASAGLSGASPRTPSGGLDSAIATQNTKLQRYLTTHHLAALTSATAASDLATQLLARSPAQAKKLIPEYQALRSQFSQAALAVERKRAATATQRQAQREWVAATQSLRFAMPLAGLSDVLDHRQTATIALRRAQRMIVKSDKLRAKADKLLGIKT